MSGRELVICVPELYRETGGIQVFSRSLIAACDELHGRPVPVISRNDRLQDLPSAFVKDRKVSCAGYLPHRLRPAGLMAASLKYRNSLILTTHPRFTPWLQVLQNRSGGRYATVAHGIEVWGEWSDAFRRGMTGAARILAVSNFTADSIRARAGDATPPIDIFPNTFDPARFSPAPAPKAIRQRLEIPEDATVLLTVARVARTEERKGYRQILDLLPGLMREFPRLYWVLGGRGNDLDQVRRDAAEAGVADRCRFPGFVPDADLPDLYRASNLFALPSKKEGFGIVFLEAIATGLPVIAGNQDGSVDALDGGNLGLLIHPDRNEELRQAIRSILSGDLREDLGDPQRLHEECRRKFGFAAFHDRLKASLAQLGWTG